MKKACIGFKMDSISDAWNHMQYEIVKDYGDYAYGHSLHTWDEGKRMLAKCKNCGGYILIQESEFHSFSDENGDSYYTDFVPVNGPKDAERLNRDYDGFKLEREFPKRYLCMSDLRLCWSRE